MEGRNGQENEQNAKPNSYLKDGTREEMGSPAAVAADSAGSDPDFNDLDIDNNNGWIDNETEKYIIMNEDTVTKEYEDQSLVNVVEYLLKHYN